MVNQLVDGDWIGTWLDYDFPETVGNGISSSQLTNSYFSEGKVNHQPASVETSMGCEIMVLYSSSFRAAQNWDWHLTDLGELIATLTPPICGTIGRSMASWLGRLCISFGIQMNPACVYDCLCHVQYICLHCIAVLISSYINLYHIYPTNPILSQPISCQVLASLAQHPVS